MLEWLRKRQAIRAYRRELGARLRSMYGKQRHYTPEEVHEAARASQLPEELLGYAVSFLAPRFDIGRIEHAASAASETEHRWDWDHRGSHHPDPQPFGMMGPWGGSDGSGLPSGGSGSSGGSGGDGGDGGCTSGGTGNPGGC